ncbi:MAG: indolepyruvate ferredoxin oxidoreductase subunit alpha [Planctomycetaceae bacterium]|nr:indolepyruvate ferredoxin oxidoreductase subunit alpha [Planctomycetaceae bacterium]
MSKHLLSGNEAIARGAWEAGVTVAAGYPGTPSTEILENVAAHYKNEIYCEWSPNEKVAFEVAAGAALTGARAMATMKHVGLNVAADPLMTLAYTGIVGGFLAVVADDPGMHSSQNEQDTRRFAQFAKVPILEPSDSQEAKEFVKYGLEISEQFQIPVILRTTTRIAHSRTLVELGERKESERPVGFVKDPPKYVAIPAWARPMRVRLEQKLVEMRQAVSKSPLNRIEWRDKKLGIITSGVAYQYVREACLEASVLKLGWSFPFPDDLIREFAAGVEKVFVVEELEDFLEEHLKALGIACSGKDVLPNIGEFSQDILSTSPTPPSAVPPLPTLPPRPPVLCAGCPHRGIYYALGKFDVVVVGDIGCYSLGTLPPLSRMDTLLCMGAGVSMAHGMDKAKNPKKIVGIVGDSTFFHSGITGLLDIVYNKGESTIIVADNRITAMTGHQETPGSGLTLMGEKTAAASIEEIGKAVGVKNTVVVDPRNIKETVKILKTAIESPEPWLIVSQSPCPLHLREPIGPPLVVDCDKCKKCGLCLKLGCPGIEKDGERIQINSLLCAGCQMCQNLCPTKAISQVIRSRE